MNEKTETYKKEILRYIKSQRIDTKKRNESISRIKDQLAQAKHEGNKIRIDALEKLLTRARSLLRKST
jgi:hypothetical protein